MTESTTTTKLGSKVCHDPHLTDTTARPEADQGMIGPSAASFLYTFRHHGERRSLTPISRGRVPVLAVCACRDGVRPAAGGRRPQLSFGIMVRLSAGARVARLPIADRLRPAWL